MKTHEDMRNLFFIIKGVYTKGVEPKFVNTKGEDTYIGGYDPYSDDTKEWYMLLDNKTYSVVSCGEDFNTVLKGVYKTIKHFNGSLKKYLKHFNGTPHTQSKIMVEIYNRVYEEYGDYYEDLITQMEDLAYEEMKEDKVIHKSRKLLSKHKKEVEMKHTPEKHTKEVPTLKKVKPKVNLGVKKLNM